jgi:hypothetical protein
MVSLLAILYSMPGLMDSIISLEETSSEVSVLENSILETNISVDSLAGTSGLPFITFNLNNEGSEKLWNYDEFEVFITYDADIAGIKTPITEKSKFGYPTDFKTQRGITIFGATGDTTTETIELVNLNSAFVKINNVVFTAADPDATTGGNRNNDDMGMRVQLTADDTITFTRLASGIDEDVRVSWEVWEYVGAPDGDNEFIVRLDTEVTTVGGASVDTSVPNVIDRNNLIPFITGVTNTGTGRTWDDATHTAEIIDAGGGLTDVRIDREGTSGTSIVGVAVVEFTGSNWIIQNNILHTVVAPATNEFQVITAVNDWSEAYIISSHKASNGGTGLDEAGWNTWPDPGNLDRVLFRMRSSSGPFATPTIIAHVAENPFMSTNHIDSITGTEIEMPAGVNTQNYAITAIIDMEQIGVFATADTEGGGTAYPRFARNYQLSSTTNLEFFTPRSGQPGDVAAQIITFPQQTPSQWKIDNIVVDALDPDIINSDETAQIRASLTYPIFSGGNVAVVVSTDKGVTSSNSVIIP